MNRADPLAMCRRVCRLYLASSNQPWKFSADEHDEKPVYLYESKISIAVVLLDADEAYLRSSDAGYLTR
jgi:hypothetical protein